MKRTRTAVAALVAVGLATGCETFGRQARRSPQEAVSGDMQADGASSSKKPSWAPGTWSSEAQDVEKSVMRDKPSANW
jgi:hypothetical protein